LESFEDVVSVVSFGFGFVAVGGSTGPPSAAAAIGLVNRSQALGTLAAALVDDVRAPAEAPAALVPTPITTAVASTPVQSLRMLSLS